jgi:hypothetical protein
MLWDHSTSKLTSPIIYNLSVEGETDQVINELTASFEVFVPQNARGKVATRKFRTEPVRTAYSTKHLKSTGKYDVALPIAASQASIYIFAAIFGQALHFGILIGRMVCRFLSSKRSYQMPMFSKGDSFLVGSKNNTSPTSLDTPKRHE